MLQASSWSPSPIRIGTGASASPHPPRASRAPTRRSRRCSTTRAPTPSWSRARRNATWSTRSSPAPPAIPALVEKPPGRDAAEAERLAALEPAVWVGFNRRFSHLAVLAPRVPENGELEVSLRLSYRRASWRAHEVSDDALGDLGPHLADLAACLLGGELSSARADSIGPRPRPGRADRRARLGHDRLSRPTPHGSSGSRCGGDPVSSRRAASTVVSRAAPSRGCAGTSTRSSNRSRGNSGRWAVLSVVRVVACSRQRAKE